MNASNVEMAKKEVRMIIKEHCLTYMYKFDARNAIKRNFDRPKPYARKRDERRAPAREFDGGKASTREADGEKAGKQ